MPALGVEGKECTFKGVEGVTLDEFVIHHSSSLQEEHSDYYRQLLENRVASMIRTDQSERKSTRKPKRRLNAMRILPHRYEICVKQMTPLNASSRMI